MKQTHRPPKRLLPVPHRVPAKRQRHDQDIFDQLRDVYEEMGHAQVYSKSGAFDRLNIQKSKTRGRRAYQQRLADARADMIADLTKIIDEGKRALGHEEGK